MKKEIERKWCLFNLPSIINELNESIVKQGYIMAESGIEVRVRSNNDSYTMTIKGDGDLVRDETEVELNKETFNYFVLAIAHPFISKKYYRYPIGGTPHVIEISHVDFDKKDADTFYYAEVEFENVADAKAFELPEWFQKETHAIEVTNDPKFKMKNYWKQTRLGNK